MSEEILLSFVVPVYNVEKYLKECLDSIFDPAADKSEYEGEYEVIAVDDGSTDSSPEILKTYTHHKNFRIITQENAGLGPARNTGINAAKGRYISFVDSDDYLLPGAVPALLGFARDSDCDIVEFEIETSYETSQKSGEPIPVVPRTPVVGKGKNLFADWRRQGVFLPSACNKIYKKDFLIANSLCFLPIIHEDVPWHTQCFFCAQKVTYHSVMLYHYRRREGSIMLSHTGSKKCWAHIKYIDVVNEFRKSIEQNEENDAFLKELGAELASRLELVINDMYKYIPKSERATMINEIKKNRELLGLAINKKGRRLYALTRWLPAKIAFKMYKVF